MGYADGLVLFPDGQGGMEQVQPGCLSVRRSDARSFYLDCQKAVLPSCEAESDAGEVRDSGRIPEIARSILFWLYVIGSFASFFIIAEQKNHSKEQPLIERLQEIRDGKYPVEKTHSPTGE